VDIWWKIGGYLVENWWIFGGKLVDIWWKIGEFFLPYLEENLKSFKKILVGLSPGLPGFTPNFSRNITFLTG